MKKTGLLPVALAVVMLLAMLAGCGEAGTKRAGAEDKMQALDALLARVADAVAGINAIGGDIVEASFGESYSALVAERDTLAAAVADAKDMAEEELDALLAQLDTTTAAAQAMADTLEAIRPELEKLDSGARALAEDMGKIAATAQSGAASAEWQQEYTALAAAYQALEGQLNDILGQANGGDLPGVLAALQQANAALAQVAEQAAGLLAGMQG